MPKMKTRRAAAKRFTVSSKGKIRYSRAFRRHLLTHKNRNRKRALSKQAETHKSDRARLLRMLPYALA